MQSLFSARSGSANSKNDSELSPIYTAQPPLHLSASLEKSALGTGGESHRPGQTTAETFSERGGASCGGGERGWNKAADGPRV